MGMLDVDDEFTCCHDKCASAVRCLEQRCPCAPRYAKFLADQRPCTCLLCKFLTGECNLCQSAIAALCFVLHLHDQQRMHITRYLYLGSQQRPVGPPIPEICN
jgi:hypothetical protein